jgi:hypothetical protein
MGLENCIVIMLFGYVVLFISEVLPKLEKYPAHIILYMFQAIYQCRRGVGSNHLTSPFRNMDFWEFFEGALNIQSFVSL